jgi:O-antigen/teichoic acid export membrane protein
MSEPRSVAVRALKAALPLYAGQAVVIAAGLGLKVALVQWIFPDSPKSMGRFTMLNELLQWTTAVGMFGLATGLQRLYPERVADRKSLVKTAWLGAVGVAVAVTAVVQFTPGLARKLLGDVVAADLFAPFAWKAPAIAATAVVVAALHASGRLREKAMLDAGERVAVAAGAVVGGAFGGLAGVLWGSFVGSLLVALFVSPRGGSFETPLLRDLARIGRAQLAFLLLDAARLVLVLRVMGHRGAGVEERGLFATAAGFALPVVVLPEMLAQALYPSMIGPRGETADVERTRRRLFLELALSWIPLLALAGAAAAWLLPHAGSGAYAGAVAPFLALLPGVAAHGLVAHTGYVVLVRDRVHEAALAAGAALVVAGAATWFLAPTWGATGAAAALSFAMIVRSALLVVAARRGRGSAAPGAPTSLDDVRRTADPATFPRDAVRDATSAACFFGAAFHGRNDAVHLADAGVADVVVVDVDDAKLAEMRAVYPAAWRFVVGDAYAAARDMASRGERVDVAVVDAWQSECDRALEELPLWLAVARRRVLVTVAKPWLDERGLAPDVASLAAWIRGRGIVAEVEALHRRADWSGGTWWLVLRVA